MAKKVRRVKRTRGDGKDNYMWQKTIAMIVFLILLGLSFLIIRPYLAAIFFGIILIPFIITRNVSLSMGIGLLFLPLVTRGMTQSGLATILAVVLGILIGLKSLPTTRRTLAEAKTKKDFIFEHSRGRRR